MRRILLAALAMAPAVAQAQTAPVAAAPAGSNMPADFYPHSPCTKPAAPPKGAPGVGDQAAMLTYNLKVKNYNAQATAFNACVRAYVDRAQNDIQHIQDIVHAAVAEANARD